MKSRSWTWGNHPTSSAAALLLAAVALAVPLAGCASLRNYEPQVDPNSLDDTLFLHYLSAVPVVSVAEGCRAVLIVAGGVEQFDGHQERYAELVRRRMVRPAWGLEPDRVLDKGTLAYMAARVCKLPGGVSTRLLGSWGLGDRRYAMRDVIAAGIMPYDVPAHAVRGGELLGVLAKIDEYLERHGLYQGNGEGTDRPNSQTATAPR